MIELEALQAVLIEYVLPIGLFFGIAYVVHRVSYPLARRFQPLGDITMRDNPRRYERLRTLQSLGSNAISILAFIVATLVSLTLFVNADTLIWVVGLFSAAFGLGARPFISDFLTGLTFIFEDSFDVGDKIEIPLVPQRVEGIVEAVSLRITRIRGMDGELFTLPNGDIRLVRNFSRGDYSPTRVTLKIPATAYEKTLTHLEGLSTQAMTLLPNLIEPWRIISQSGELGEAVELTVLAKAKFGKGAELRTHLLAVLQAELSTLNVSHEHANPKPDSTNTE
jgi:moderate conductance mechanosensitive channel